MIPSIFSFTVISVLLLFSKLGFSQEAIKKTDKERDIIQFSGIVVEMDSLRPIPFTKILIKNSNRGTLSDYYGYFSFVAQKKDTLIFSGLGYKKSQYIIPDTLRGNKYSLIQLMSMDTIFLKETTVYPWPTKEQFKEVFLNMKIPDDDLARAQKNLAREEMRDNYSTIAMDGNMNFKSQMQQYQSRLYWAGQYPSNNLLNPFAWAQFLKMWREGKLKLKSPSKEKEY